MDPDAISFTNLSPGDVLPAKPILIKPPDNASTGTNQVRMLISFENLTGKAGEIEIFRDLELHSNIGLQVNTVHRTIRGKEQIEILVEISNQGTHPMEIKVDVNGHPREVDSLPRAQSVTLRVGEFKKLAPFVIDASQYQSVKSLRVVASESGGSFANYRVLLHESE